MDQKQNAVNTADTENTTNANTINKVNATNTVTLYTTQRDEVVRILDEQEVYYVKSKFIQEKYGEVAHLFFAAYQWYLKTAPQYVTRPIEAESAVWAFMSSQDAAPYEGCKRLTLQVPFDEAIFFDMLEWSDILNFRYLGSSEERLRFERKLQDQGVKEPMQLVTTPFYPILKQELLRSWNHLYRHHDAVKHGEPVSASHLQAGLWKIKKEWIIAVE